MKLADWMEKEGHTPTTLAPLLKVKEKAVRRYCLTPEKVDFRRPAPEVMQRLADLSAGAVTPNDFYGIASRRKRAA